MADKMTRVEALSIAIEEVEGINPAAYEVLVHMRDQLMKPKAKSTSKSKTRLENEAIVKAFYNVCNDGTFDGKYVMEHTSAMTPQKVTGLMKVGIELGLFEKLKDGKVTVYRAVR